MEPNNGFSEYGSINAQDVGIATMVADKNIGESTNDEIPNILNDDTLMNKNKKKKAAAYSKKYRHKKKMERQNFNDDLKKAEESNERLKKMFKMSEELIESIVEEILERTRIEDPSDFIQTFSQSGMNHSYNFVKLKLMDKKEGYE